jgi:hypothetical protein
MNLANPLRLSAELPTNLLYDTVLLLPSRSTLYYQLNVSTCSQRLQYVASAPASLYTLLPKLDPFFSAAYSLNSAQ